ATAIAMSLAALAGALADRDPQRARALLLEGVSVNSAGGHAFRGELTHGTLIACRIGDWPLVLHLARQSIPLLHWSGDTPQLAGIFNVVARALASTDPERGQMLQGASHQFVPRAEGSATAPPIGGIVVDARREATAIVRAALGDDELRRQRGAGETMDPDDAVAFALAAIDGALASGSER